ncbi:helix-turn-helix domain-containing protein [Mucilaginibacter lappiensis]|uniref:Transcriptional regulator with XRE-family HTH domain n=1 Tax=Mucilaginibacter lappiensis TaxID=354630 RepID=A0A1N6PNQ3_9SPHI|nr:XRE family transcriptional regulator [Mucilaginibacter lappiensis]MBB6107513.1 transcriptional regulator with XRE-family HTH domain [Mucilaginibacter lappiensis]MBB6126168.1 transcriptional regulator with XRE-family HTH domain [Mucilaginibacter lappiensis]SIQ06014.1 transcriptional regulator, XRE family with cupin sensor [Mucilaginibacter lappiensis]
MQDDIILKISYRLKEIRKDKRITIQELADKAGVSKGLISQIENNRTIPSLPVLMNIVQSLNLDLTEFFKDLSSKGHQEKVFVIRSSEYSPIQKEASKGFSYQRMLTRNIQGGPVDFVLLELKKGARRNKMVVTDAFEYKYLIKGRIDYLIEDKNYILEEGDSIFFDGRLGHSLSNIGDSQAIMLVVYYFISND